jgi:hypothetical protein
VDIDDLQQKYSDYRTIMCELIDFFSERKMLIDGFDTAIIGVDINSYQELFVNYKKYAKKNYYKPLMDLFISLTQFVIASKPKDLH